ncbi:hypothetical protein Tco_0918579 [Tanacetum coccineum]
MGDENPIHTLGDYSKPSYTGYRNTIELPEGNNVLERPKGFAKLVKAISLPQDVPSTSDRHLIELENQVQRLMEAHMAPTQPTQVNKITSLCEICSGPHDTQYCMENLEQAFVEYASLRIDEAGGKWYTFKPEQNNIGDTYNPSWKSHPNLSDTVKNPKLSTTPVLSGRSNPTQDPQCSNHVHGSINAITIHPKQPEESQVNRPDEEQEEEGNLRNASSYPHPQPDLLASIATEQVRKLNSMLESLGLVPLSSNMKFVCSKKDDREVMFIEIIRDDDEPQNKGPNDGKGATTEGPVVEYFDTFPTRDELTYHNSIIDPRLSQVVLGKPFVEISNMTHDPQEGVVRFTNGNDEVAYKMPHKIEQYNSLSNLEKEHTKSVYLRNEEDKRRGVEYVMSKILGFYKECLELGPEYLTGIEDEGEVT